MKSDRWSEVLRTTSDGLYDLSLYNECFVSNLVRIVGFLVHVRSHLHSDRLSVSCSILCPCTRVQSPLEEEETPLNFTDI